MFKYNQQINFEDNTSHGELVKFIKQGDAVLEFGCANGDFSAYIKDNLGCSVYGIEISNEAFERAKEHLDNGFCCDIEKYEWKKALGDLRFDTIVFADVLEHLRNPEKALREASEFLKDDGKIIFSVPNIAHSDVIIKLMQNSFDYTDIGILDNTHVHFFAKNNIKPFVESAGLFLSYLGATFAPFGSTEQKSDESEDKYARLLKDKSNHDIYQFIGVCNKKEYAEKNQLTFNDVLLGRSYEDKSKVYIGDANGIFSENNSMEFSNKDGKVDISIDVDHLKNKTIRLDIRENSGYLLYDTFFGFDTEEVIQPKVIQGISEYEGVYVITGNDSQFIFDIPKGATKFVATANVVELYDNVITERICNVLNRFALHKEESVLRVKELDEKFKIAENELKKSNTKVETLKKTVSKSQTKILSLNREVKNFEVREEQLEDRIKSLYAELELYKTHYSAAIDQRTELTEGLANVTLKYDTISQSQSWKVTKPIRVFLDFVKRFLGFNMIGKFFSTLRKDGFKAAVYKVNEHKKKAEKLKNISESYRISEDERKNQENAKFDKDIKFSVLVPLYNTPEKFLMEMIDSVQDQTYKNWELCLADGSDSEHKSVGDVCKEYVKNDKRIKYKKLDKNLGISENTNACIDMSSGNFIALFDHDDILHPSAFYEMMKEICENNADFVYTDEATFKSPNVDDIITVHHKPDYAVDNLRANNYICHFSAFSRDVLEKAGPFRRQYDGSQDHDMILRLTENAKNVVHIPKVLYFWRSHPLSVAMDINSKTYAIEAGKKAVKDSIERSGYEADVFSSRAFPTIYRIRYKLKSLDKVSIIIPNKNHKKDLKKCVESIISKSMYKNYEIVIIDNGSDEEEIFEYYEEIKKNEFVKVIPYDIEFNYSKLNNYASQFADGKYYILLNNDIEIITPDWIEEMLMYAQRDDVGAVGAMLYYPDETIQHAGVIMRLGAARIAGHAFNRCPRNAVGYMGRLCYAQDMSAVTAACMMVKASVYKEVGGFEENLKVAYNDIDFCLKIREAGYLIVWTPYAEAYHYESKSRGAEDETEEKKMRYESEVKFFKEKWKKVLDKSDPYYNPNFSLDTSTFDLA